MLCRFTDPEQLNNYYLDNLRNKRLPVAASPLVYALWS